ncbi:MerR family transcriptional regulator [Leptospira sp. 201903070]|jgi:DNA-binding transcriptional MerR regulator|uniref:MerR family transcriptional regulator n=1 Tax=Leptospira ainlahdjerensis TaxID=2810033 RepID=A0ABS2U679_9LEPT|nr:MerR family transcriptional regulator [Leptospira ainlahdjerensis]MBM9575880.1 MerR family transcriptional regulator [Leptospira ainlahdjerensis]
MKKSSNLKDKNNSDRKDLDIDLEILGKLVVGIGEVSEITQIPIRKIRYWEEKGIISSVTEEEGKNRRYDYLNIKKILLIKELLDEGFTLEAAATKVENRIATVNSVFERLTQSKKPKI